MLEIGEDAYTSRLGGPRVTHIEILDVDAGNPKATVIGDLTACDHIPSDSFRLIILTQTLHMVFDIQAVLANIHRLLRRAGWCWLPSQASARSTLARVGIAGSGT